MQHYVVYLDEFGHIGPFVARDHAKYNDSPVFGLAGFMLPAAQVREFAIYFYKLKCHLLAWDLEHKNPHDLPACRWEKKGSALFTARNVLTYQSLRQATFRLLNRIAAVGGHVVYTGEHKVSDAGLHFPAEIFKRQLLCAVRQVDGHCAQTNATCMVLLDHQDAGDEWRERNVEACTVAMFEDEDGRCRRLIEPPLQGESHLFQTLQCADWLCGLIGRLSAHAAAPDEYADWAVFHKYFHDRVRAVALDSSGIQEHARVMTSEPVVELD
ncbi:DUF3800 domain-containing protein [Cupriavidus sp. SW-Y-13]|uniref:DUF3800 domain-containing protein n=1 Tax=Cupriavidus sp. SW-Y-13 TaxID=2653854 RepID=UPI001F44DC16|nr:DUF3800 domain-containing protein [Cupriavidus sp. SW-Y-13]